MIKTSDWRLVGFSVAIGSVITITYNILEPCFSGLFQSDIHNFTCNSNSGAIALAGLVSFSIGFVYLLIYKKWYKNDRT